MISSTFFSPSSVQSVQMWAELHNRRTIYFRATNSASFSLFFLPLLSFALPKSKPQIGSFLSLNFMSRDCCSTITDARLIREALLGNNRLLVIGKSSQFSHPTSMMRQDFTQTCSEICFHEDNQSSNCYLMEFFFAWLLPNILWLSLIVIFSVIWALSLGPSIKLYM